MDKLEGAYVGKAPSAFDVNLVCTIEKHIKKYGLSLIKKWKSFVLETKAPFNELLWKEFEEKLTPSIRKVEPWNILGLLEVTLFYDPVVDGIKKSPEWIEIVSKFRPTPIVDHKVPGGLDAPGSFIPLDLDRPMYEVNSFKQAVSKPPLHLYSFHPEKE